MREAIAGARRARAAGAWPWTRRCAARAPRVSSAAMTDAGAMYLPERLHAVRIAVKKLRYALELVERARRRQARPRSLMR